MAKITYLLSNFDSSKAKSGELCAMVVLSPSTVSDNKIANLINSGTESTPSWGVNHELKGVGICRFVQPNRYLFTVNSVTYTFDDKGAAISINAKGNKLWLASVDNRSVGGTGAAIPTNTSGGVTRSGGTITGTEDYELSDSLTLIDSLQARDQFAMQALRAILGHIDDPSVLGDNEINYYCEASYKWAAYMMRSAADARGSYSAGTATIDVTNLESNTEILLNNLIQELAKNDTNITVGSQQVGADRITIPELNAILNVYLERTPAAGDTDQREKYQFKDLITAIQGIGGGGGSSFNGEIKNAAGTSLGVSLGGAGSSSANPLYISGGSNITVDSGLSSSSSNPVMNSVITNALSGKQDTLVAGSGITISGNEISATGGGGGGVTVDSTLSTTSANPVMNRVIAQALTQKQNNLTAGTGISIVNDVISATGGGGTDVSGIVSALKSTSGVTDTVYTKLNQILNSLGYDPQGLEGTVTTQDSRLTDLRTQLYNLVGTQNCDPNASGHSTTSTAYWLSQIASALGSSGGSIRRDTTANLVSETLSEFLVFCTADNLPRKASISKIVSTLSGDLDSRYELRKSVEEVSFNSTAQSRTIVPVIEDTAFRMLGTLDGTLEITLPDVEDRSHQTVITVLFSTKTSLSPSSLVSAYLVVNPYSSADDAIYQTGYNSTNGWTLETGSTYMAEFTYYPAQGEDSSSLWVLGYKKVS